MERLIVAGILAAAFTSTASAQTFTSGSTGTDGALVLTTPGTVEFDPVALGIDPDGDLVCNFTTITIGPGVTVRFSAQRLDNAVVWLATGDVRIEGILDLNGERGQSDIEVAEQGARRAVAGAGGFGGGLGSRNDTEAAQAGLGPGGGSPGTTFGVGGGNASHAIQAPNAGPPYGNDFLLPLVGGSGGGGRSVNPPTASFAIPDVTINDSAPVTVNVAATHIPVGTVVQLYLLPETGPGQVVASTPLTGTTAASTATVSVTIPAGFSRGFVRAVFTPAAP